jgi:hypothetical protein
VTLGKRPHVTAVFAEDDHVNVLPAEQVDRVEDHAGESDSKRLGAHHPVVNNEDRAPLTARRGMVKVTECFVHVRLLVVTQRALVVADLLGVMPTVDFDDETRAGFVLEQFVETATGAQVATDRYFRGQVCEAGYFESVANRMDRY